MPLCFGVSFLNFQTNNSYYSSSYHVYSSNRIIQGNDSEQSTFIYGVFPPSLNHFAKRAHPQLFDQTVSISPLLMTFY